MSTSAVELEVASSEAQEVVREEQYVLTERARTKEVKPYCSPSSAHVMPGTLVRAKYRQTA